MDIACYQIALARDSSANAQYVSCTQLYPPRELSEQAKLRRLARSGTGLAQNDWETILSRTTEEARQFFRERLKQKSRTNSRNDALAYPQTGRIRWYVMAKRTTPAVLQIGRFRYGQQDDESFWRVNLSKTDFRYPRKGALLRFYLKTSSDFEFFQKTMDTVASAFSWRTDKGIAEESTEESEAALAVE